MIKDLPYLSHLISQLGQMLDKPYRGQDQLYVILMKLYEQDNLTRFLQIL